MGPEHVSSVIPRALNGQKASDAHLVPSTTGRSRPATVHPKTLPELVQVFEAEEALENPDLVTKLSSIRMEENGLVALPSLGSFVLTDWSRAQLASVVGLRWSRFFENATSNDEAEELNRRLARSTAMARVRTSGFGDGGEGTKANGVLKAFVSSTYSPVSDSRLARHLAETLRPKDPELRLIRYDLTERTSSYVVKLGDTYRQGDRNANVGDCWGGILVRNSGVGFASLVLTLHLTRLVCLNGMCLPIPDALLVKRRHRGIDDDALKQLLSERLEDVAGRLHQGQTRLRAAVAHTVDDVPAELRTILQNAELPQRLMPALLSAYGREPEPTRFGVSQAITLAAQSMSPEERLELEEAAGNYLAAN